MAKHDCKNYLRVHGIYDNTIFLFEVNGETRKARILHIYGNEIILGDLKYRTMYTLKIENIINRIIVIDEHKPVQFRCETRPMHL